MKKYYILAFIASNIIILPQTKFANKISFTNKISFSVFTGSPPVVSVNCTSTSTGCVSLPLTGNNDAGTAFHGKADPSAMKDPNTGTIFLCYSFATSVTGAPAITTNLAKSTDNGVNYTFVGVMYASTTQVDNNSGNTLRSSNEVCKILSIDNGDGTTSWIVSRVNYFTLAAGGGPAITYTKRASIAVGLGDASTGPFPVRTATPQWIGTSNNTINATVIAQYPIDYNFQTLNAALNGCTSFIEPTMIIDPTDGKLVYSIECGNVHFQPQFVTNTAPTAGSWVWTYVVGSDAFGTPTDAADLCTHTSGCGFSNLALTEFDFGKNAAGTVQGTAVTVGSFTSGRFSTGCVWAEMDMSSRPYTFKKTLGIINVDATITSSDSVTGGPGSCTYQPAASMYIAHKLTPPTTTFLMDSGLKP